VHGTAAVCCSSLVGIGVVGVFGLGVAKQLSPYGATDPSTESVQATNRYQAATGRQIDPGVIALVTTGNVHSARAERQVRRVEARLRASRDVAAVSSYYDSHDAAMAARNGRSSYVVAYFRPRSDSRIQDDAQRLESQFAADPNVELGGDAIASAQANTQVGHDLARAELLAFPFIFLLSLCSSVRSSRRCCRRCSEASRSWRPSSRCGSSRASPTCRCSRSTW
jgi:RND superfamily putative drug exporter